HIFSLLQSPDRFLLPQIGNNQSHLNRAHGISEIEGKVARVATSELGSERVSSPSITRQDVATSPPCNSVLGAHAPRMLFCASSRKRSLRFYGLSVMSAS